MLKYPTDEDISLPVNSDSTECVDEDTGGEEAPSRVVVDEAAVVPASDGAVLVAPCKAKQNKIQKKNISEILLFYYLATEILDASYCFSADSNKWIG